MSPVIFECELSEPAQVGQVMAEATGRTARELAAPTVELREARTTMDVPKIPDEHRRALEDKFREAGFDDRTAVLLAEGRDGSDPELREGLHRWEAARQAEMVHAGVALGLSEAAAVEFARGRSSTAAIRENAHPAPAPAEEQALATSFERLGLSESAARHAARGR